MSIMEKLPITSTVSVAQNQIFLLRPPSSWSWEGLTYDVKATLTCGQSFCWRENPSGVWEGWVDRIPCEIKKDGKRWKISGAGLTRQLVNRYFQTEVNIGLIHKTFPDDPWMSEALAYAGGMRLLRQDPWETTANFICSAMKSVPQIMMMNCALRVKLGDEIESGLYAFPSPSQVASATESDLRACKLGFRAPHLLKTARQIDSGEIILKELENLNTDQAREQLTRLRGVGEKVANCILLFAFGRNEAFPIDVWVDRILKGLYFRGKRKVTLKRMKVFADEYFGPNAGYAQQYLFHWMRNLSRSELNDLLNPKSKCSKK